MPEVSTRKKLLKDEFGGTIIEGGDEVSQDPAVQAQTVSRVHEPPPPGQGADSDGGVDLLSLLNGTGKAIGGVMTGVGKSAASSIVGAGQAVNKATKPFGPGGQVGVADAIDTMSGAPGANSLEYERRRAQPQGTAESVGYAGGELLQLLGGGFTKAGTNIAARVLGPRAASMLTEGAGSGIVRYGQTGGDASEAAQSAALAPAGRLLSEGTRGVARAIEPYVINKVIGATKGLNRGLAALGLPNVKEVVRTAGGITAEGFPSHTAVRETALEIVRTTGQTIKNIEGFKAVTGEFLKQMRPAIKHAERVMRAVEKAKNRGAVPGHGSVPKVLKAQVPEAKAALAKGYNASLVNMSLDGALASKGASGAPAYLRPAITWGVAEGAGQMAGIPGLGSAFLVAGAAYKGLTTARMAQKLVKFAERRQPGQKLQTAGLAIGTASDQPDEEE